MKKIIFLALINLLVLSGVVSASYIDAKPQLTVLEAMGISDTTEITGGCILSIDKEMAMDMTDSQIEKFVEGAGTMVLDRKITKNPFNGIAIILRTKHGEKTYYLNSGVQVGLFGDENYLCYYSEDDNEAINSLYKNFMSSKHKLYNYSLFVINDDYDYLIYPSDIWAVNDVLNSAANSLVPYEVTESFGRAISREEVCMLSANFIAVYCNYKNLQGYFIERDFSYLTNCFSDTKGRHNSIDMLYALGVVNGKEDGTFGPGDAVTREEMAIVLRNTAIAAGISMPSDNVDFIDIGDVSKEALDAVKSVGSNGVMSGSDGEFKPKDFITTEEAVISVNKLYKLAKKK